MVGDALAALDGVDEDAAEAVEVAPPAVEVASPEVLEASVSPPVAATAAAEASAM